MTQKDDLDILMEALVDTAKERNATNDTFAAALALLLNRVTPLAPSLRKSDAPYSVTVGNGDGDDPG